MNANEAELNYCRVDQWHKAGLTGKGMKVAIREVSGISSKNWPRYEGRVLDPTGTRFSDKVDTHQQSVIDFVLLVAPHVEIHLLGDNWLENLQYCIDHKIDVLNYSGTGGYNDPEFNALEKQAMDGGTVFICCAGNDGSDFTDSLTGFSRKKSWISVGSVRWGTFHDFTGPLPNSYSSFDTYGDDLDVMGFSDGLRVPSGASASGVMGVTGTSFACPWVVGLVALWKQKFAADNGRKPTFAETIKFIITNAQDIEAVGYDQKTGHGVLRLPELPTTPPTPIWDIMKLMIGSKGATFNGDPVALAVAPTIINGYTMVGLRGVLEQFGLDVEWNAAHREVVISRIHS